MQIFRYFALCPWLSLSPRCPEKSPHRNLLFERNHTGDQYSHMIAYTCITLLCSVISPMKKLSLRCLEKASSNVTQLVQMTFHLSLIMLVGFLWIIWVFVTIANKYITIPHSSGCSCQMFIGNSSNFFTWGPKASLVPICIWRINTVCLISF